MPADELLKERLYSGADTFLRPKKEEFQHYTPKDEMIVNTAIHSVEDFLKEKLGFTYGIEDYLRTS